MYGLSFPRFCCFFSFSLKQKSEEPNQPIHLSIKCNSKIALNYPKKYLFCLLSQSRFELVRLFAISEPASSTSRLRYKHQTNLGLWQVKVVFLWSKQERILKRSLKIWNTGTETSSSQLYKPSFLHTTEKKVFFYKSLQKFNLRYIIMALWVKMLAIQTCQLTRDQSLGPM